jgi:tetratricopeptide (TPR) repeat protein
MVIVGSVSLLLLFGLGTLLYFRETRIQEPPRLLTADIVEAAGTNATVQPANEDSLLLARTAFDSGEYELAAQRIRTQFPDGLSTMPVEALDLLARCEERLGHDQIAIDALDKAIEIKPTGALHYRRGILHRKANRLHDARADFDAAVDLEPADTLFSNERYLLMIQTGEQEVVEKAIKLKMDLGLQSAWIGSAGALAVLELQKGNVQEAANILKLIHSASDEASFDALLANPMLLQFQNNPLILPYYIKTSVQRQRK